MCGAEPDGIGRRDDEDPLRRSQDEFDRAFFADILRRGHSNPDVLRRQAENLARDGEYGAALELDRVLAARYSQDPVVQYNLACSLSMTGALCESVHTLARALELGYADFAHLEVDSDLDPVRETAAYHELMRRHGRGEADQRIV